MDPKFRVFRVEQQPPGWEGGERMGTDRERKDHDLQFPGAEGSSGYLQLTVDFKITRREGLNVRTQRNIKYLR